jgi:CRP-like cAMP-binding protein
MHSTGAAVDAAQLADHPLFSCLDTAAVDEIARSGWLVSHVRGERVLSRGDMLDGLYLVITGRLKLYMLSCNGDERVLRVLQEDDTFGEAIMFNRIPSPVFVDAMAASQLGFFPRDAIVRALTSQPDFVDSMLQNMSALMAALIRDLETCCMQNAAQRTVAYLLRQAGLSPPPHVALTLPAPKAVIASTLNLSAETFSRELHRLQDLGLIRVERRVVHLLDRQALAAIGRGDPVR